MRADADELYKHRIIQFCRFHPDPDQVRSAALWLQGVAGVQTVELLPPHALALVYDLRLVTLERIEHALSELGYHLDNSLLCKLRRALFYYTEETQRVITPRKPSGRIWPSFRTARSSSGKCSSIATSE